MPCPKDINFLIVDDYDSIRAMLHRQITEFKLEGNIYQAHNVDYALEILEKKTVGFIISDWSMPGKTGLDFLQIVRKKHPKLPFLMLTTISEKANVLNAIMQGASNYLLKPWSFEELVDRIDSSWDKHNKKK